MTPTEPTAPELPASIPVRSDIRDLLFNIAEGWTPSPMVVGPVEHLRFNDIDFSEVAPQVHLEGDRLVATLGQGRHSFRTRELLPFPFGGALEGTCSSKTTFHGSSILHVSWGADLTIELGSWVVLDGDAPSLWIGRVEGAKNLTFGGNLIVERTRADGLHLGRAGHLRLSGTYVYYLVQSGERSKPVWHLLLDTGAGVPDEEALGRDFLLLQFVLGRQLRIAELLGVTGGGRTVGSTTGSGTRTNLQRRSVPPVPFGQNNDAWIDECWAALLFERASAILTARPETRTAYMMAFDSYLDSMTLHVDADYLRLQITLEAFAYWILQLASQEERAVVKDKAAWKQWVKDHSAEIRALASPGFEDSLFNRVIAVYRPSSGRVVPSAFLDFDLTLTPEMADELKNRDVVVHQGLMAPDGYEGERELRRIAMVRTLLVALMARTVDYGGAINGWEIGALGRPVEPVDWWTIRTDDRRLASQTFIAEKPLGE
ncbi:MAG: hypothetical protein WDO69_33645 [Pseudomonadota bacterium]